MDELAEERNIALERDEVEEALHNTLDVIEARQRELLELMLCVCARTRAFVLCLFSLYPS